MPTLSQKAAEARKAVLTMIHEAGTSHIASNFSVIDIATVIYDKLKKNDEVVWSAGWKAATIYYFLAQEGKIPKEDLKRFAKEEDGKIEYLGLAETNVPGVHVNGGSVGHGLPVAAGMALAKKIKGESGTVHCIVSDGELNEGTVWETVMFAKHNMLGNLVVWVDANKWQAMGKTEDVIDIEPITRRFEGFGWDALDVDGHDHDEIEVVMKSLKIIAGLGHPTVFVCHTIKGKGVSFMENHLLFHYKHVDDEDYEKAMKEL